MKVELSSHERDHLHALLKERPEWNVVVLAERMWDEQDGSRSHKYAKSHPYLTGMKYVLDRVREMKPERVLDIGSPIAQNVALACMDGPQVTVLDVRPNEDSEMLGLKWANANSTSLPYPDASWDFVTSLWVMGHVGDGRYGDELDTEGDLKMLSEVSRILAPGGHAILGPGLVDDRAGNIFNLHRIYTWPWLRSAFGAAGLEILEEVNLPVADEWYIDKVNPGQLCQREGHYALAMLRKK